MKKRMAALLLFALFLLSMPLSVFAEDNKARVSVGEVQASYRAGEVTLPVVFENVRELMFVSVTLTFDNALGEIALIAEDDGTSVTMKNEETDEEGRSRASITWMHNGDGQSGTFTAFTLSFTLSPTAKPGDYPVIVSSLSADTESSPDSVDGRVTLTELVIYGDCDSNGKVTVKDVLAIIRRIAGYTNDIDVLCADVNLDDKIDIVDAQTILRHLAGWENARLGHRDKTEIITPATCQSVGEARLTCTECGDSVVVSIGKGSHEYERGICKFCSERGSEYPFFAYCDHLKRYYPYDENLRGYAAYVTYKFDGYKLFISNIYDTETDSLCLFSTAYFDSGLTSTVSIDVTDVEGKYKYYYECTYGDENAAVMSGLVDSDPSSLTVRSYEGDEGLTESHLQIAGSITYHTFEYMAKLLSGTELGISIGDFGITLG